MQSCKTIFEGSFILKQCEALYNLNRQLYHRLYQCKRENGKDDGRNDVGSKERIYAANKRRENKSGAGLKTVQMNNQQHRTQIPLIVMIC